MLWLIATFVLFSLVIVVAGVALTRLTDRIATGTGLGHTIAGGLLLAAATSLPELSVGWAAVRLGAGDLAVGELLGSCLWNLMLLGLVDLLTRQRGRMFSRASAGQALAAAISLVLVAIAMAGLVLDGTVTLFRLGPASWGILVGYGLCARLVYRDQEAVSEVESPEREAVARTLQAVAGYLLAAGVIFFAAPRLASTAERFAEATGLATSFLGASLVGLVTSLPEMVTTYAAVRLGRLEMAVANIFGSNGFNLVILAIVDLATPEALLGFASDAHLVAAIAVVLTTATALIALLYRAEKRFWMVEPDAALVVVMVVASLFVLFKVTHDAGLHP